jgi:hypothetical protein
MPIADEDLATLLARVPAIFDPTPAATAEATAALKRGQNAALEPDGERTALGCYRDALLLDPGCKPAYEALAKYLLARPALARPAAEAAARYFEVAVKKLPNDATIQDLARRVRGLLSEGAAIEPALAKSTGKFSPGAPEPKKGTGRAAPPGKQRKCEYCGSPIPIGSEKCKSCNISGEIKRPDFDQMKERRASSRRLLVLLLLATLATAGILVWRIVGHPR